MCFGQTKSGRPRNYERNGMICKQSAEMKNEPMAQPQSLKEILQLASEVESPNRSERTGLKTLPLVPANRRLLPTCHRDLRTVDPDLLEWCDRLVSGRERWPLYLFGRAGGGSWPILARGAWGGRWRGCDPR